MLHLIKKWKKERKEGQTELERTAKAKEAEREREILLHCWTKDRGRWRIGIHSANPLASPSTPPPLIFLSNAAQWVISASFFPFFIYLFIFIVMIWLVLRLCFWVCTLIVLELIDFWERGFGLCCVCNYCECVVNSFVNKQYVIKLREQLYIS